MRHYCALAAFLITAAGPAGAQPFPSKPIRLIIPMAAGGATDIFIRTLTPRMTELFGQPVVVDNREIGRAHV